MSLLRWSAAGLIAAFELCSSAPAMAEKDPVCGARRDCRPLTSGEIKFAKTIFGNRMDYDVVRIVDRPSALFALYADAKVHGSRIHYHDRSIISKDHAKESSVNRGMIAHELGHVWQNQSGIDVNGQGFALFLRYPMNYNAAYKYKVGKSFADYNIEQQAKIIEHYVVMRDLYAELQGDLKGTKGKKREGIKTRMADTCKGIADRYEILSPVLPLSPHKCNRAPR